MTAAVAALGLAAAGLTMAVVAPANAAITAPAAGTIVGSFTFSDSGGANTAGTIPLVGGFYCTNDSLGGTKFEILSGSTVVFSQQIQGTGPKSVNIDSATLANGTYTLRGTDINITSTFLGIGCKGSNQTPTTRVITIANVLQVQGLQSGLATSGPQNTLVPVKATVVDPNAAVGPKAGVPVTFSLSGSAATVTIPTDANGVAAGNLAVNGPPGSRTLTASTQNLFGVPKYPTATASTPFEITKNASITTVAPPAPVVHGQATSFSATVVAGNGTGTPTGTVQFKVDGTDLGSPVNLSGGTANSSSTSGLSTGSHAITAVYSGDGGFEGSTSAAKTQVVGKADTTTTLTDAPSPTVSGQATTFTAHVTVVPPGVGTLAGGVQFNIDGNPFGTAVPLGAGDDATLTVSNLSTGNHDVVAVYNGNADFATSSSAHLTHGVNRADTTLVLSSSSNPAFSGAPITYTAAVAPVSPGAGNPTGDVQFAVDGVNLGAPVPLSGGTATSPVSTQQVGNHTITADYVGDLNFAGQSDTLVQHVVAAQTTTSISVSPNPSVHGQAVNIHVEVIPNAPATGHPTGTIRFVVDGATYDFVDMVNGAADLSISSLTTGAHTIKAVYLSDDLNFFTSTSETVNQQVNKASTKTTVTSSSPTAVFGQPITFTATVAVLAPGAGTPAGTIVFKDGATVIGTQPVSSSTGEQASVTVSNLSVGQHAVSATYSGDDDFNGSNGSASQTVTRAQTTTVLVSSANPAQSGQGIQYTATITPVAPGAGNPTGTVRFFVNGANIGGPVAVSNGQATSANFASLTPGIYKISATYSGDGNFVGST
ncbi:MAG: Ig-like domain repeat protein, partial [Marmoricola sp.]